MKKSIISVFVIAAAAIALVSCNKEVPQNNEAPLQKASTVSFVASQPDTKAAFGTQSGSTLPTLWTSNDTRAVTILNCTSAALTTITPSSDGKTAYFDTAISDDETGSYSFSLLSPLSAFYGYTDSLKLTDGSYIPIVAYEIPSVQTSGADTPDEAAMVLFAATDKLSAWPTEQLDVTFHHLTAYLKLDLQNLDLDEGENVETVVITSESNLAGVRVVNADNGDSDFYDGSTSIVVNTSGNNPVWVACAPLDEGTVLTITAKTDAKYEYEVEYTTPADLSAGTVAEATIDYDGVMGTEVLFSYDDWLGTFLIDRDGDGATIDTVSISQDVRGESYTVYNVCSFGEEVPAYYDATTGSLQLVNVDSLFSYEHQTYGPVNVHFSGFIPYSSTQNQPIFGVGTYLIATATLEGAVATITPEDIDITWSGESTATTYTFNGMGFVGEILEGTHAGYYLNYRGYGPTALPNTMTKVTLSGAPRVNSLGHAVPAKRLEGILSKNQVLKLK